MRPADRRRWSLGRLGNASAIRALARERDAPATTAGGEAAAWSRLRATRTQAVMFAAAGVLGLVIVALPHGPDFHPLGVAVPAGLGLAYASFLLACGDRLALLVQHVGTLLAIGLISVAAYASASLSTAIAILYVWAGTFSFLFFTRGVAFWYVALIAGAYAVVVATAPGNDGALSRWLLVTGGVLVTAVVVSGLIEEIRRLAAAESSAAAEKSRLAEAAERRREYLQSL